MLLPYNKVHYTLIFYNFQFIAIRQNLIKVSINNIKCEDTKF